MTADSLHRADNPAFRAAETSEDTSGLIAPLAPPASDAPVTDLPRALGLLMLELLETKIGTADALLFAVRATEATRPNTHERRQQDRVFALLTARIGAAAVSGEG